ncbi:MAG TPA: GrpB family protein [Chloroflexota bacterium]
MRDYLRRHADIANAYGQLKGALALVFEEDIAGYREAKRPFLQALLAKARAVTRPIPRETPPSASAAMPR